MSLDALRALGTGPEAPATAKARVAAAIASSLGASLATSAALTKSASPSIAATPIAGVAGSKVAAIAVAAWLAGGLTGAAVYRGFRPQEVRIVYADTSHAASASTAVTAPSSAAAASDTSTSASASGAASANPMPAVSSEHRAMSTSAPSAVPTGDLARERALLDQARAAAAHGEPAQALATTERHRLQFPRGRLREEREALAIRALISLGRANEARTRAEAFRATYPRSLLLPALDAALSQP